MATPVKGPLVNAIKEVQELIIKEEEKDSYERDEELLEKLHFIHSELQIGLAIITNRQLKIW